jgi:carboxypeptidase Taq
VEADEVTYNLHILIRFELEQELVEGTLSADDAPQAWNDRYHRYLGIKPENHRDGILQDVHWSAGLIGYFPTYSLGNLYAAQLMQAAERELGAFSGSFLAGEFQPLLGWLRQRVHAQGRRRIPSQLVRDIAGAPLSAQPLLDYLRQKLVLAYGLV